MGQTESEMTHDDDVVDADIDEFEYLAALSSEELSELEAIIERLSEKT